MRSSRRAVALVPALIIGLLSGSAASAATTWSSVALDQTGGAFGPSVAITPSGTVGVAWWNRASSFNPFSAGLSLATGSGSSFATSVISTGDYAYPSLAYDSAGVARISAMVAGGAGGMEYLEVNAGVVTETLVTSDSLQDRPSLRVAPGGQTRIAYATLDGVVVARLTSGGWTTEPVWSGFATGPRLAIDSAGVDHVVWATRDPVSGSPAGFFYATDAGGGWAVTRLSSSVDDSWPVIAVDSGRVPHVVYVHAGRRSVDLREFKRVKKPWKSATILGGQFDVPELVIGADNTEHIAAYGLDGGVHYVSNVSGRFVDSIVDPSGLNMVALGLTPSGTAYVTTLQGGVCCPFTGGLFVWHN